MSYLIERFGVDNKQQIKDFLIKEGFEPYNEVFPNNLNFFSQSEEYNIGIKVDLDEKEINYYVDYRYGGGTVRNEYRSYEADFEDFEKKYKETIDEASMWM